jgi:putative transposase
MTSPSDRKYILQIADEANKTARLFKIAETLEISKKTLERWRDDEQGHGDKRSCSQHPKPKNSLSDDEEKEVLRYCNSVEFENLTPEQIVPTLIDRGKYVASESTYYRILRKNKQLKHRGKASEPVKRSIPRAKATEPNQVYSWDITYLKTGTKGIYFYLYMFIDIFSRKIVGWEIHNEESGDLAAEMLQKIVLAENLSLKPPLLHSDNGAPMKSQVLRRKVEDLGVNLSYSRPRVSNDNPFSESLFGTLKMRPEFPKKSFESIEKAREWTASFTHFYNFHHKHSGIKYVTPVERHTGLDKEILRKRELVYQKARGKHPERWSGKSKNLDYIDEVFINKPKDSLARVE